MRQVEQPHSTDGEALAQKGVLVTAMPWLHPTFTVTLRNNEACRLATSNGAAARLFC